MERYRSLNKAQTALVEVGILFLPAIPAYLWLWPNVAGSSNLAVQCLTYVYVLAGTVWIGLRRWNLPELGINRNGLGVSLGSGLAILLGRTFVILSVDWGMSPTPSSLGQLIGDLLFYFGLVGLVEELLFRGLVYRALEDWRGLNWAIWGSSLGFMLWHIFGQGPLVGAATFLYGLIFALVRWRAGGILGLIIVHGMIDLAAVQMLPDTNVVGLGRLEINSLTLMVLGLILIVVTPIYLWRLHPYMEGFLANKRS